MAWTIFGSLTSAQGGQLDANFSALAVMGFYPCTASGTNAITLTPTSNAPALVGYQNFQGLGFVVPNNTTGAVTLRAGGLGFLPVYWPSGTQVGSGDLTSGELCLVSYNAALNSGNGGFSVVTPTQAVQLPQLHSQLITASGSFTIPAAAKSTTPFKFTLGGGGAAGGGATTASGAAGAGGSSGAVIEVVYSGFTAGQNVTVTLGAAGADSSLTYASVVIATAKAGNVGATGTAATQVVVGGAAPTGSSASAGASGLTLVSSTVPGFAENGQNAMNSVAGGGGSAWPFGIGGAPTSTTGNGFAANGYSAGGGGAVRGGSDNTGGAGTAGACLVEWVL